MNGSASERRELRRVWIAALCALLPLVVMPITLAIYWPLIRQPFPDTPDVYQKMARIDTIMYTGFWLSILSCVAAAGYATYTFLSAHGLRDRDPLPRRYSALAAVLTLAIIELLVLCPWLYFMSWQIAWRSG